VKFYSGIDPIVVKKIEADGIFISSQTSQLFFLNTKVNKDDHQKLAQTVKIVSIFPGGHYG